MTNLTTGGAKASFCPREGREEQEDSASVSLIFRGVSVPARGVRSKNRRKGNHYEVHVSVPARGVRSKVSGGDIVELEILFLSPRGA